MFSSLPLTICCIFWPNFHALDALSAFGVSFSASWVPHGNFLVSGLRKPWTDWRVTKSLRLFLEGHIRFLSQRRAGITAQNFLGPSTISPHGTTNSNQILHDDQTKTNIFICLGQNYLTRMLMYWKAEREWPSFTGGSYTYTPTIWPRATKFCTVMHVREDAFLRDEPCPHLKAWGPSVPKIFGDPIYELSSWATYLCPYGLTKCD